MKYQMTVDGVLVADYYNVEKALDHTFVALEDARFVSVGLTKLNDDGSVYVAGGQEQAESPVEAPQPDPTAVAPAAEVGYVDPAAVPASDDPTSAAPVQL